MEAAAITKKKKRIPEPHAYVMLFLVICLAMVLTWVIPAGNFDRTLDEATGRTLVVPGTYHHVEDTPVNPIQMITCIFKGFENAAQTVFFTFFVFVYINTIFKTGAFAGALKALMRLTRGKTHLIIPVFMIFFLILGTTSGTVEATYGMIPAFVGMAIAMGYDAMVGLCMVELAVFTGFTCSTMNPFTIGIAQQVSELPLFSGMGFRFIILLVTGFVVIAYSMRYAAKIKADPTRSVVADIDFSNLGMSHSDIEGARWTWREACIIGTFGVSVAGMVVGSIWLGWGTYQYVTLFTCMMILSGIIHGWNANQIAANFVESAQAGLFGCFVIGLSRGVLIVMEEGNITDSIIYYLSLPLSAMPKWMGAQAMFFMQMFIDFLIPSGSGQAATTMPIMAPLTDIVGITRQTGVLCFQFGDGWSNLLWPTGNAIVFCGIAGVPLSRWFKFWWKLAIITFLLCMLFIFIATMMDYGPF